MYEVLSEDRDGVSAFMTAIAARGFIVESVAAPAALCTAFQTRTWSQQHAERYRIYAIRRPACRHPSILP